MFEGKKVRIARLWD